MKRILVVFSLLLAFLAVQACLCTSQEFLGGLPGIGDIRIANIDDTMVTDYTGSWHSSHPCAESESEPYKWGITLVQDTENQVTGTIYFHNCPGNGAVTYQVHGKHLDGEVSLRLEGSITGGRGDLYNNVPSTQVFKITFNQPPDPNFSE